MDDEEKFWAWIVGVISVSVVTLILGALYLDNVKTKMFVDGGYTRVTLAGSAATQWVVDPNSK